METGENKNHLLKAQDFNIDLSDQYHLSIEINHKSLSFAITDINNLHCKLFEEYKFISDSIDTTTNEIKNIIQKHAIVNTTFNSLSLTYSGFPSTLVPKKLFKQEEAKELLSFNTNTYEEILTDKIVSQDAILIYSIPKEIRHIGDTFFPEAKIISEESILIQQYLQRKEYGTRAYVNISNNKVMITILDAEKLLLNNTFEFITEEDLLYYILFCLQQMNLSKERTQVVLSGNIRKDDKNYKIAYDYIQEISFCNRDKKLIFSNELSSIEKHSNLTLFSQILCV